MNDYIVSIIRTVVPNLVAVVLTAVAVRLGPVPDDLATDITVALTAAAVAVYYAVARQLETKAPRVPWLGVRRTPTYSPDVD